MTHAGLIPWLDPEVIITGTGPWALLVVCAIIFAETGLLVGFLFPGDTLLVITGLLTFHPGIGFNIWIVALLVGIAAFLGGEVGYFIGNRAGPKIFERKESGFFSVENVKRTNAFFRKFGPLAVVLARFVPVVRTFAPVAAGVGHMNYRRYSLYNLVGALLWATGLAFFGYFLSYVPPIADFVRSYIDYILMAAVVISVSPVALHYLHARHKAKRAAKLGKRTTTDAAEAEALRLDASVFDRHKR